MTENGARKAECLTSYLGPEVQAHWLERAFAQSLSFFEDRQIYRTGEGSAWKKTMAMHPSRNLRMQVWEEIQETQLAMHSKSDWWPLIWYRDLTVENVSFEDGGFLSSLPPERENDERILSIRPLWQGQADCADSSFYTTGEKHIRKCPKHVLVKKGFVINICFWKMAYNSDFIVQHFWNKNIFFFVTVHPK